MDLTEFIAKNLFGIHSILAGASGNPIWALERTEADEIGKAVTNVTRHYDVPGMSQQTVDWFMLLQALGTVYGTRLFAIRMGKANAPAPAAPGAPAAVKTDAPKPAPANPPASQNGRAARAGHVWASPGPGLPDVEIPMN